MGDFLVDRLRKPWRLINFIYHFTEASKKEQVTIKQLHEFTYRIIKERAKALKEEKAECVMATTYSGRKISRMLDLLLHEKLQSDVIDYEGIREEVDTFMFEVKPNPVKSTIIRFESFFRVMTLRQQLWYSCSTIWPQILKFRNWLERN